MAVILILAIGLFIIANKVAVGFTFFSVALITSTFGLVLHAFWTNVYIFCVAEILVLVWGLVVAVARLIPGEAGRPIRMIATAYTGRLFAASRSSSASTSSASACRSPACRSSRTFHRNGTRSSP